MCIFVCVVCIIRCCCSFVLCTWGCCFACVVCCLPLTWCLFLAACSFAAYDYVFKAILSSLPYVGV